LAKECVCRKDDAYVPNFMRLRPKANSGVLTNLQQDEENKSNNEHII